jgi:ribonuclease HII
MTQKYVIGIDEAGRGPIAGPVAVGGVKIAYTELAGLKNEVLEAYMKGSLKDSKKLSEKKREEIFTWMQKKQEEGVLHFVVSMGSAHTIDTMGIVPTIRKAISRVLTQLAKGKEGEVMVRLDGGLTAPEAFRYQQTIVRGDENDIAIALASVAAKVTRDEYMKAASKDHVAYGFERHKGYGTKAHYEMMQEYGLSEEHRRSFCRGVE